MPWGLKRYQQTGDLHFVTFSRYREAGPCFPPPHERVPCPSRVLCERAGPLADIIQNNPTPGPRQTTENHKPTTEPAAGGPAFPSPNNHNEGAPLFAFFAKGGRRESRLNPPD